MDHYNALPDPQEDPNVGPTIPSMACAASALVTLCKCICKIVTFCFHTPTYDCLAAVALGADHQPAHQAQGRGLALPGHAVLAAEVGREVHQISVVVRQRDQTPPPLGLNKI